MNNFLTKLKNPGTIMSTGCLLGLLFMQFGVKVDMVWLETTLKIICSLGVIVGVLNNTDTPGIDNPFKANIETKEDEK